MSSLTELNTYSATGVDYTPQDTDISISAGVEFDVPYITWDLARSIGNTATSNARVTITHPNTTLSFPNLGQAQNSLTVSNVSATVTSVSGMQTYQDWTASFAIGNCTANSQTFTTVFSDHADSANITITVNGL